MLSKTNLTGKTISRQIYNTKSKKLPYERFNSG